jgi:hypothetical protein
MPLFDWNSAGFRFAPGTLASGTQQFVAVIANYGGNNETHFSCCPINFYHRRCDGAVLRDESHEQEGAAYRCGQTSFMKKCKVDVRNKSRQQGRQAASGAAKTAS